MDKLDTTQDLQGAGKTPTLAYSCVVDRNPVIERSALIWVTCLLDIETVAPEKIFVHTVETDLDVLPQLAARGVNIVPVPRFGDGKYCNKLVQPLSPANFDADILVMNDCDIAATGRFGTALSAEAAMAGQVSGRFALGKTADFPNPPLAKIRTLMEAFKAAPPEALAHDSLFYHPLPLGYFNGGLYALPVSLCAEFGAAWQDWALRLLGDPRTAKILERHAHHVDQISFYLALRDLKLHPHCLDERFNFPTHFPHPESRNASIEPALAIHFHNNLDDRGLLGLSGIRAIDRDVIRVNDRLSALGLETDWNPGEDKRFRSWRSLEAGVSMTTKNAPLLKSLLQAAGIETAESVTDVCCGSGAHLVGLSPRGYRGFDRRARMAEAATQRLPEASFTTGAADAPGDLVLCLDFAEYVAGFDAPDQSVRMLAELTGDKLLLLGEPRSSAQGDLVRLLRGTGDFPEILRLGQFAGRPVYLALKRSDASDLELLDMAQPEAARLLQYLYAGKAMIPARFGAELEVLSRMPTCLDAARIAVLGGDPTGSFATALALRGVEIVAESSLALTAEGAAPTRGGDKPRPVDVLIGFAGFDEDGRSDAALRQIARNLVPGGRGIVAAATAKRSDALVPGSEGAETGAQVIRLLEKQNLVLTHQARVPTPFGTELDGLVIEVVKPRVGIVGTRKKFRTPKFLRDFERNLRHRIKGKKPKS
ncbi:hypothetical protein AB0T83_00795 [Fluviibacterium sp. DFM31]|uniref:Methyltransferase domain-containing protein n=1 Tax=Meridianimarinicoccus marinus TaxID=3231483 RepID=A0ABV3L2L5_9RHOB